MSYSTSYLRYDISKLAQDCRLKASASRFQVNKCCNFASADKAAFDQLVSKAKDQSIYLWMLHLPHSTRHDLLRALADSYSLAADFLDLLNALLGSAKRQSLLPRTLTTLAESQCLLRSIAIDLGVTHDLTQFGIHRIITDQASQECIYVERCLRDEDRVEVTILPWLRQEQKRLAALVAKSGSKSNRSASKVNSKPNVKMNAHPKVVSVLLIGQENAAFTDRIKSELGIDLKVASSKKSDSYRRFIDRATSDKFTHVVVAGFDSITDLGKLAHICKVCEKPFRTIGGKLTIAKLLRALEGKD